MLYHSSVTGEVRRIEDHPVSPSGGYSDVYLGEVVYHVSSMSGLVLLLASGCKESGWVRRKWRYSLCAVLTKHQRRRRYVHSTVANYMADIFFHSGS